MYFAAIPRNFVMPGKLPTMSFLRFVGFSSCRLQCQRLISLLAIQRNPNRLSIHQTLQSKRFPRFYSSIDNEVAQAKQWLKSFTPQQIPKHMFDVSFSRASGPGGQKVNKTSSKATVSLDPHQWLDPQSCYWIPKAVRQQIQHKKIRFETKSGGLLIQSDLSRNRDVNISECFSKLLSEIKLAVYFEEEMSEDDKKKWEELKLRSKEKRLFSKKKNSEKKKSRSKNFDI